MLVILAGNKYTILQVWMTCKIDGKEFSATGCTNMVAKKNVAYVAGRPLRRNILIFLVFDSSASLSQIMLSVKSLCFVDQ